MSAKITTAIVILTVIMFSLIWVVSMIQKQAAQEALDNVRKANIAAGTKADKGQRAVEACFDAGGVWDRVGGLCSKPSGR